MFSQAFMQFLIKYQDAPKKQSKDNTIQEIEFKPVKVKEAARVVVSAIKETF